MKWISPPLTFHISSLAHIKIVQEDLIYECGYIVVDISPWIVVYFVYFGKWNFSMEGDISDDMLCGTKSGTGIYATAAVADLSPFAKTRTFVTKITTYAHFRREKNKDFINKVYITVPCLPAKYQ